ncbi:MAG TPA: hypothetical protein VFV38_02905, partial [Ktedonobacteraceae bacterium]|nr:hypothetical protein [Ktedonobacteraceae bacterium]
PGRYYGFQRLLESRLSDQTTLLTRKPPVQNVWSGLIYEYRGKSEFLHMLAITYREYVLMQLARGEHREAYVTIHTILWTLLLCTDGFWQSFSQERTANSVGEREKLSDTQQEKLFEEAIDNLLSLSLTHAGRAFAEARYNDARIHLRCLHLCSQGTEVLRKTLRQYQLAFEIPLNVERERKMSTTASGMLTQWCSQLLREAEEASGSLLESGKNYEAGIQKLKPFIDMQIPVKRVLVICLGWYNAWCLQIQRRNQSAFPNQLFTVIASASSIADQLIPLCAKGRGFLPENRAIALHLVWRGVTAYAPVGTVRNFYREALQWDASNRDAQQSLKNLPEEDEGDEFDEEEFDEEEDDDYFDDSFDYYDGSY